MNKYLPLKEELPPEPRTPSTTDIAADIIYRAFITGANAAATDQYRYHLREIGILAPLGV